MNAAVRVSLQNAFAKLKANHLNKSATKSTRKNTARSVCKSVCVCVGWRFHTVSFECQTEDKKKRTKLFCSPVLRLAFQLATIVFSRLFLFVCLVFPLSTLCRNINTAQKDVFAGWQMYRQTDCLLKFYTILLFSLFPTLNVQIFLWKMDNFTRTFCLCESATHTVNDDGTFMITLHVQCRQYYTNIND